MEGEGLAHLLLSQHLDQDLAAAHRHVVRDLSAALRLQPEISLSSVDTFVVSSLHLSDTNTKGTDEHCDGGVCNVVRDPDETNNHGVVTDVHHRHVNSPHVESVLSQMGETLSLTETDKHFTAGLSHSLN